MKLGIVIYSGESETIWNAFRVANFNKSMGDEVNVFLLGKGVEYQTLDTDTFKVTDQVKELFSAGGKIYACGTCLEIHEVQVPEGITVASLKDLYDIIQQSDKVITF